MKNLKIILLHFESVFEHRTRSFVWFLISLFNPLLLLLFWRGALQNNSSSSWNLATISSYYLILVVAGSLLSSHIEEDVAYYDIKEGDLSSYILKPISYYWIKFYQEIPYRIIQGFYGIVVFVIFYLSFGTHLKLGNTPYEILMSIVIAATALFLSFTFKMIIGLLAFWVTDIGGVHQLVEVITILFGGYILPISLFPGIFKDLANLLPFAYMIYYPILAFQGQILGTELLITFGHQLIWLTILLFVYKLLWKTGVKKFTGIGQ